MTCKQGWTAALALMVMLVCAPIAIAAETAHVTMVLTGKISVGDDGKPRSYSIDKAALVPVSLQHWLASTIAQWRFVPPGLTRHPGSDAVMTLHLALFSDSDASAGVHLTRADFADSSQADAAAARGIGYQNTDYAVVYPPDAIAARIEGIAWILVRFDRQGVVSQAAVEQVDLRHDGSAEDMARWRSEFGQAGIDAVTHWTFRAPSVAQDPKNLAWCARVPVDFHLNIIGQSSTPPGVYGEWALTYPGSSKRPDWYRSCADASKQTQSPLSTLTLISPLNPGTATIAPAQSSKD